MEREKCENCDRFKANDEDWSHVKACKEPYCSFGSDLCWGHCEPPDWKERFLVEKQRVDVLREMLELAEKGLKEHCVEVSDLKSEVCRLNDFIENVYKDLPDSAKETALKAAREWRK